MSIEHVIVKQPHDLGGGFEVGRVLPARARRMVGPFIFFDHMGPVALAAGIPRDLDVRPHPHIGLSTVTYLFDGALTHRDSLGFQQEIRPGEVNWMVAGRGITHSERFEYAGAHGARMHGIQAWVALPTSDEETDPAFSHHPADAMPNWTEPGVQGRLIAGVAEGMTAPVRTHSPLFYMHLEMAAQARRSVPAEHEERAIYIAHGAVDVAGQRLAAGSMAVLTPGRAVEIVAATSSAGLMVLGGAPIGERFLFWNFVSSSRERIEQAKEDWRLQRMKLPGGDNAEFTPLPGRPAALVNPALAAWLPFHERARLVPGETVLVLGASGTAGQMAVTLARQLGARRVVACGRRVAVLERLAADAIIDLAAPDAQVARAFGAEVRRGRGVIVDYLWGQPAELLIGQFAQSDLSPVPDARAIRFVCIGAMAGPTVPLASGVLRGSRLEIMGSGTGNFPDAAGMAAATSRVFDLALAGHLPIRVQTAPLEDVARVWDLDAPDLRWVLTP